MRSILCLLGWSLNKRVWFLQAGCIAADGGDHACDENLFLKIDMGAAAISDNRIRESRRIKWTVNASSSVLTFPLSDKTHCFPSAGLSRTKRQAQRQVRGS